jgi:hypothetical protein
MSPGVMRPSRSTAVASTIASATPPTARLPRWTRCQSLASPSCDEYWHMGDMTMRFLNVTPRMVSGLNSECLATVCMGPETGDACRAKLRVPSS